LLVQPVSEQKHTHVYTLVGQRKQCFKFLKDRGMKFSDDNKHLDTKASRATR
jgi:hypothetical protein